MDLKTFISETIIQIQDGVQTAITHCTATGANGAINPVFGGVAEHGPQHVQMVEFDVAVTATDTNSGKVGGGLKVWSIGVNGEGQNSTQHSTVSRIKFNVPIIPPTQVVLPPDE